MPNALWEMQGLQRRATHGEARRRRPATATASTTPFEARDSPARWTPAQFDQAVRDITAFLRVRRPSRPRSSARSIGVWVILFLAFFTFLAWLLKNEYWRDVH